MESTKIEKLSNLITSSSNATSSSNLNPYWNPEQPPPVTKTRKFELELDSFLITSKILFNEFLGMSYLVLGLSVGTTVTLMMYFKIIHPPAAANPLIALFADVSLGYIVFPVIVGSIVIIVLSVIINRYFLKRNYPIKWI